MKRKKKNEMWYKKDVLLKVTTLRTWTKIPRIPLSHDANTMLSTAAPMEMQESRAEHRGERPLACVSDAADSIASDVISLHGCKEIGRLEREDTLGSIVRLERYIVLHCECDLNCIE